MNLVQRLRASGIAAYHNVNPTTDPFGGAAVISFGLCQNAEECILGDNEIPEIAPPVFIEGETTIEDYLRAAQEVDRKVCEMFGITEKLVLVNHATHQIELALFQDRKDGVAARWLSNIGWFN